MAVGHDGESVGDDGRNCAGTEDGVKGGGTDGVPIRERELGSEGCNAKGSGVIPPYSCLADCRNDISSS